MSNVNFDFSGENFVVTGASSGMGRQIALELAMAGANVLAIARNEQRLLELQNSCPKNIFISAVDVKDYANINKAISDFVEKNGKLHGGVYCAGILGLTPLRAFDESLAHEIMDISYWSGVNFIQHCSKVKNSNNGSSFVLFSSAGASKVAKGMFAYSSAKSSLEIAVRVFAKELSSRSIRTNAISPGWVYTDMTKGSDKTHNLDEVNANSLLGLGNPDDVSGMVLFLLSNRARWITGTNVVVDGGYLA